MEPLLEEVWPETQAGRPRERGPGRWSPAPEQGGREGRCGGKEGFFLTPSSLLATDCSPGGLGLQLLYGLEFKC